MQLSRPNYISEYEWSTMSDQDQQAELQQLARDEALLRTPASRLPKIRKPRVSKKLPPPVMIMPRTMDEAFALVDGKLKRRRVARLTQRNGSSRTVEHLTSCGARVRYDGRVYSAAVVMHYLTTGELVHRAPQPAPAPRYRARVREGARIIHIGYYATPDERDAAVFAHKLGIKPIGCK